MAAATTTAAGQIVRSNPPVGYLDDDVFETLAFTQVIRADRTVYLSGIAPLMGPVADLQIVAPGDMAGQIGFVLDVLERCLGHEGLGWEELVAVTVYVTDIEALAAEGSMIAQRFGAFTPTSTWVEVRKLIHPEQLIEITGIAVAM
jgi:2-iminobutanoate/2-iminopropanoate deaminase